MTRGSQLSRSKIHRIYSNAKFKLNISDKEILEEALFCLAWNTWSAVFRSVIPFPPWKVWIVASIIIHTLHVELNYAGKSTYQKNRWQAENEVLSMNSEPFKNLTSAITSFAHKPDDMQRLYTIICSTWSFCKAHDKGHARIKEYFAWHTNIWKPHYSKAVTCYINENMKSISNVTERGKYTL